MAIYKKPYSGLITKGLGGPACCGMLTLGFGLFSCVVAVYEPPVGGGGSYPVDPGIYVPWRPKIPAKTKTVQITIKMPTSKDQRVWRRAYTVSTHKADLVVKAFGMVNALSNRLSVGVASVKHAAKRVVAVFNRDK